MLAGVLQVVTGHALQKSLASRAVLSQSAVTLSCVVLTKTC